MVQFPYDPFSLTPIKQQDDLSGVIFIEAILAFSKVSGQVGFFLVLLYTASFPP